MSAHEENRRFALRNSADGCKNHMAAATAAEIIAIVSGIFSLPKPQLRHEKISEADTAATVIKISALKERRLNGAEK
jgi:hypothetical protein